MELIAVELHVGQQIINAYEYEMRSLAATDFSHVFTTA
jgi:hypothetical protein